MPMHLKLEPPFPVEKIEEVVAFFKNLGSNTCICDPSIDGIFAGQEFVRKYGVTALLDTQLILEQVLPPSEPRDVLADTFRYMLTLVNPERELLVVDPYIFSSGIKPSDYTSHVSFFEEITGEVLQVINLLQIITKPSGSQLERFFLESLATSHPNLRVQVKYTDEFHDRFWIADQCRGLYVGSSLNGIGRRYCLVDYLSPSDASEIVLACSKY